MQVTSQSVNQFNSSVVVNQSFCQFSVNQSSVSECDQPYNSLPPPSPFHYDVPYVSEFGVSPCSTRELGQGSDTKKRAYTPATFDPQELPKHLQPFANQIAEVCHILHHRRLQEQRGKDEFINLKTEYLRTELGKTTDRRHLWDVLKPHLLGTVIETDRKYTIGSKSYGYRLVAKYRDQKMVCRMINSPTKKQPIKAPVTALHRFLVANLHRVTLDQQWRETSDERLQATCQRIADGDLFWQPKDEFGHRFHSNLTNAPREMKDLLRVDGQPLCEIDIANSQPLWAAFEIRQRNLPDCEEYIHLCERGELYDHFCQYGFTRQQVKDEFRQSILFKKNGYNSPTKTHFKQDFPAVNAFWEKCKKKDPKTFAKMLQRRESKFVLYTVVDGLRRMNPDMFLATIHDSLLCLPADADLVQGVLKDESLKLGINIKTTVKHFGQHSVLGSK